MPRIRSIKPSFFASEDVSVLPLRARLTWIGLWTHCDDQGRAKDNLKLIKAAVWPLDDVSLRDIEEDLVTLADHGRIVRYEVDGKGYLAITNWGAHQAINRPTSSPHPAPPEHSPTPQGGLTEHSLNGHGALKRSSDPLYGGKGGEGKGEEGRGSARERDAEQPPRPDEPDHEPPHGVVTGSAVTPTAPPPRRCPRHLDTEDPPACTACRDARLRRDDHDQAAKTRPTPVAVSPPCPDHPEHPATRCPRCAAEAVPAPTDLRSRMRGAS